MSALICGDLRFSGRPNQYQSCLENAVIRRIAMNMAEVCLRSHGDISGGRETLPIVVDDNVSLLDAGLLDFMVLIIFVLYSVPAAGRLTT